MVWRTPKAVGVVGEGKLDMEEFVDKEDEDERERRRFLVVVGLSDQAGG